MEYELNGRNAAENLDSSRMGHGEVDEIENYCVKWSKLFGIHRMLPNADAPQKTRSAIRVRATKDALQCDFIRKSKMFPNASQRRPRTDRSQSSYCRIPALHSTQTATPVCLCDFHKYFHTSRIIFQLILPDSCVPVDRFDAISSGKMVFNIG